MEGFVSDENLSCLFSVSSPSHRFHEGESSQSLVPFEKKTFKHTRTCSHRMISYTHGGKVLLQRHHQQKWPNKKNSDYSHVSFKCFETKSKLEKKNQVAHNFLGKQKMDPTLRCISPIRKWALSKKPC